MTDIKLEFNNLSRIDAVLKTADIVFDPTPMQAKKYHKKDDWLKIVQDGGVLLSASINNNVVAFAICENRNDALHIWNVGVLPEYRKIGLWKQMHEKIVEYAKNQKFNKLTLNTYKDKFPAMYNFVKQNGYVEAKTVFDEAQHLTKSCFERVL